MELDPYGFCCCVLMMDASMYEGRGVQEASELETEMRNERGDVRLPSVSRLAV